MGGYLWVRDKKQGQEKGEMLIFYIAYASVLLKFLN